MPAFASCRSGWRKWSRLAAVLVAAPVVTAPWLAGAEEPASSPLEDVKVDLKAIKRGNDSELPAAPAGPGISVPRLIPVQGESPPLASPPAARPNLQIGRKPANANWLLEAMELHARTRPSQGAGAKALAKNESFTVDSSDPAYLLKLYLAQDSPAEERSETSLRRKESPAVKEMEVGVLDGFLRQWIDPRDLTLLGLDATAQAGAADLLPPVNAGSAGVLGRTPIPPASHNPYLEALKFDLIPADLAPVAPPPVILPPPAAAVSPVPKNDSNLPAERSPPSSSAEDKKYFPQLKRF